MIKVTNEALIARLNKIYEVAKCGRPVCGIEVQKKAWFFDEEFQAYALMREKNGKEIMPKIFTVPQDCL